MSLKKDDLEKLAEAEEILAFCYFGDDLFGSFGQYTTEVLEEVIVAYLKTSQERIDFFKQCCRSAQLQLEN